MGIDTVLVTGATGRIGPTIVEHLRDRYRVVGASRTGGDVGDAHLRGDLADPGEAYGVLAESGADALVHLGMPSDPEGRPGHATVLDMVASSYCLLEAAAALDLSSVVLASSMSVLGAGFDPGPVRLSYLPVDEAHPATPRDPYGLGKRLMEVAADGVGRRPGAPTLTSLRFPWVPRPADIEAAFRDRDRSLAALRDHPEYHSIRNTLFAYLHVDDAARAVAGALRADHAGHEVCWAAAADTGVVEPTADLVEAVYPEVPRRRAFSGTESLVDVSKARPLLGWDPRRSWREA